MTKSFELKDKKLEEFFILPPYTNESLAIRYPLHALKAPAIAELGKITDRLLLRKIIL